MKIHFSYKYFLILLITAAFFNCSKSETENIPTEVEINDFVWKGLNAYYLWQSYFPNLQDTRFSSQSQLNSFTAGFDSPESIFNSLLKKPEDRFSIIVDDYIALENAFQGISVSNGMEFGLVRNKNGSDNVFGYVRYVVPASDAATKGVTRGMIFSTIDGTQITTTNFRSLLFGTNTNYTVGFATYNNGNPISNGNTIALSKSQIQENPVAIAKILNEGGKKIGYLLYNQFARNYDGELNAAFNTFKSAAIDELIIDLRYNGGGSVATATYLGSMVTGQFNNEIYSKQSWNEKVHKANPDTERFINRFTSQIRNTDNSGNVVLEQSINSLNLTSVNFIVTASTASASELVINSLRSYISVAAVGTTTVGKQVGSITLYDSDGYSRTGTNLNTNHTYAMQPLVLEIVNKDDKNEINGFTPGSANLSGVELAEDFGNLGVLGERSDPLLDRLLTYIITGSKGISKANDFNFIEVSNSKIELPTSNNMYVDLKEKLIK
ncbi:MAG: S41 family peptidase [Polaribacter sp.]